MKNFYKEWEKEEGEFSAKSYLDGWAQAKKAMFCPPPIVARRELGVTAEELSELIGVSIRTVWRWESGERQRSVEDCIKMNELLKINEEKISPLILKTKLGLSDEQIMKILNASETDLLSWRQGSYSVDVKQKVLVKKALEFGKAKGLIKD